MDVVFVRQKAAAGPGTVLPLTRRPTKYVHVVSALKLNVAFLRAPQTTGYIPAVVLERLQSLVEKSSLGEYGA